jgi:hypothetical protein
MTKAELEAYVATLEAQVASLEAGNDRPAGKVLSHNHIEQVASETRSALYEYLKVVVARAERIVLDKCARIAEENNGNVAATKIREML